MLSRLILIFFLVILAFAAMESTFALWAMRQFRWGPEQVGYVFAYVGVLSAVLQGGLIGRLTQRFGEERLLLCGLVLIGARAVWCCRSPARCRCSAPRSAVLAIGIGLTQPSLNSLISRRAGRDEQGEVLGVAQSVGSLSRVLGPAMAGFLFADLGRGSPFLCGAVLIAVALLLALNLFRGLGAAPLAGGRADRPRGMSRRGRPIIAGPAAAERPAQKTSCARSARSPLICGRAIRRSCGCGWCWRSAFWSPAGWSTSPSRFSTSTRSTPWRRARRSIAVPVALIVAYGLARVMAQGFNELRNAVFAKVDPARGAAARPVGVPPCPRAGAALSSRTPHRRVVAGDRARHRRHRISCCLSCCSTSSRPCSRSCWSAAILWRLYNWTFAAVTFATIVLYIGFTFLVTDWRVRFRRDMNERNSEANTKAIDSLLNFETVKYFANEEHEARRYDAALHAYERAAVKSETTLAVLNLGQGMIIAVGLVGVMILAAQGVAATRHDGRRFRAGQRLSDPALHAAQFPRRRLSQHQAVARPISSR